MLALGRKIPIERRGNAFTPKRVGERLAGKQSAPIDPGAEIGRDGDVRRRGDDTLRNWVFPAAEFVEQCAETRLRRHHRLDRHSQIRRRLDARGSVPTAAGRERYAVEKLLQLVLREAEPFELVPFMPGANVHRRAQAFRLRRRHQACVIVLVAGERQPEAFDGVADKADRPLVIDLAERLNQRRQVVAREICHQARELRVGARLDQPRDVPLIADLIEEAPAPGGAALEDERGVELVGAVIDPLAQTLATRFAECLL